MRKGEFTSKPTIKSIGLSFTGFILFGIFSYIMISNTWNFNEISGKVILWILTSIFIFFSAISLFSLFNLKYYILTNNFFLIKWPLLFYSKTTKISDINHISQKKYDINSSSDGRELGIYNGLQTILKLKNGKSIKFNSFETNDYNKLNDKLWKIVKNRSKRNTDIYKRKNKNKWSGYGWLIFSVIVTSLLLFYTIFNK